MGSDAPFHLARIESLNQALQMGIFPVKVHPSLAYSYGYGVGIFYPDFFIYLPAVLRMAGCSLEVSHFASGIVCFHVCLRTKKNRRYPSGAGRRNIVFVLLSCYRWDF